MQPYLFPYAGYFRLLAAAETFVVFDDVQFPRRGRVHRCELSPMQSGPHWLTLPLTKQRRSVKISDLQFAPDAREAFDRRLARLPWLREAHGPLAAPLRAHLYGPMQTPASFVLASVRLVADALGLPARIVLSSELAVARSADRAARIAAIVRAAGGDTYLSAPGGRALYGYEAFEANDVRLRFLEPYAGPYRYLLPALAHESVDALRADVFTNL